MAFADHIAEDVGGFYYLRISGIPFVFHNASALPAAWLTGGNVVIGGETYAPSGTLMADKGFTYKNTIEAKSGLGKSSGMGISFQMGDTWLDLTSIHLYRAGGKRYTIMGDSDVVPGATTIPFDSTTGAAPGDDLYAGLETMDLTSVDTSQTITASRGLFDSQERRFAGATDGALETGSFGAWVIDHPGVWVGRTVQIWLATGQWYGMDFVPFGATIESAEDKRIFVGTIAKSPPDKTTNRAQYTLQPLDRLLTEDVAFRLPTIDAGHRTTAQLPVDGESDRVTFSVFVDKEDPYTVSTPLLSSQGYSTAHGMIPVGTLMDDIAHTIKTTIEAEAIVPSWWVVGTTSISLSPSIDDNKLTINLQLHSPGTVTFVFYDLQISAYAGSIWRVLGFEGLHSAAVTGKTLETSSIEYTAQRGLPWLYISQAGLINGNRVRIWFRNVHGPALDMTPGWKDAAGVDIPAYVRVDGEVFEVDAVNSYPRYGEQWFFLSTTGRAQLGSQATEHYIEAGEDVPDGMQLVAFPGMQLPKAWLQLLMGGSGTKGHNGTGEYDQGWYGAGAYIDAQWIDTQSFEDVATARGIITDNLAVGEATPTRDLAQGDLIAQGLSIIAGPDGIKLLDVYPPTTADGATAVLHLDETNTRTIGKGGIPVDTGEDRIVNDCQAHIRYNNGTGEYGWPIQMIAADSIGTYGRKPPLVMKLRSLGGDGSQNVARESMQRIQDAYKAPYAVIGPLEVHTPDWYTVELGDVVTLSHALVPTITNGLSFVTPGRGVDTLPARIMGITQNYPKTGKQFKGARGTCLLVVGNISDTQAVDWSPSAYCSARTDATCTIKARYGGLEGAEFKPDDLVLLRSYDGSTQEDGEVNSAVTGTIILQATPTISPPFLIEPREYAEALQAAQKFTTYGTDGTHELVGAAGNDLPRIYR